jgi:hypothetical protein
LLKHKNMCLGVVPHVRGSLFRRHQHCTISCRIAVVSKPLPCSRTD